MSYVDGFLVPVPQQNLAAYRTMARKAGKIRREHGALEYIECVADDVKPGKLTSFPQAVKLKDGEVVVFSWIVYASRRDRDRINKLVMTDPRLAAMMIRSRCRSTAGGCSSAVSSRSSRCSRASPAQHIDIRRF